MKEICPRQEGTRSHSPQNSLPTTMQSAVAFFLIILISLSSSDYVDHCGVTEAVVRLVLSGLVGIATIVFLVDHLRFCSSQRRAASSV